MPGSGRCIRTRLRTAASVLDDAWRTLLMHEFHDILPGSSIATVYWDARLALTDLGEKLAALT